MKAVYCKHCGKRVLRRNGFFRTWPATIALHHDCAAAYMAVLRKRKATSPGYGSSKED